MNSLLPAPSSVCVISRFSTNSIIFENFQNFRSFKSRLIQIYLFVSDFSLVLRIPEENRVKYNLNSRLRWGAQYPDTQSALIILLLEISMIKVVFLTEGNTSLISDRRNSFNCNFKKSANQQIIIFYSPSNVLLLVCVPFPPGFNL